MNRTQIYIHEIKKINVNPTEEYPTMSEIIIDGDVRLVLGKEGIKEFVKDLMFEFNKAYPDSLVEILQDPDFSDVRDVLIVDEVAELDTEIRLLKEELKEVKSNLVSCEVLVGTYEDYRD